MIAPKIVILCLSFLSINTATFQTPNNQNSSTRISDFLKKFHQDDYELKFERIERVYFKKENTKKFDIVTFKYNRTFTAVNMTWISVVDIGYNYNIVVQAYKFASNEYRLFPMRFQLNFCDSIQENVFGLQSTIHCGNFTGCPLFKNRSYKLCNWSPEQANFPPLIPNGEYMLELQGLFGTAEMYLIRGYGTVSRPIAKN